MLKDLKTNLEQLEALSEEVKDGVAESNKLVGEIENIGMIIITTRKDLEVVLKFNSGNRALKGNVAMDTASTYEYNMSSV